MTTRVAPNVRYVEIRYDDDLRRIALREMGNASKWLDLVTLNDLRPPFIAEKASAGVLAYGDKIMVPSPVSTISANTDQSEVYGIDMLVSGKKLPVVDGDFAVVSGLPNLWQALIHHVTVEKRELAFHPSFGCHIRSLLGKVNGPTAGQLAAFYVKSAILEDSRVASVPSCDAEILGDQIRVTANVQPISGKPVELKVVL